jgi:hypothetical protein
MQQTAITTHLLLLQPLLLICYILTGWDPSCGGTSQHGRWANFRNEKYRNAPLRRGLSNAFFRKVS